METEKKPIEKERVYYSDGFFASQNKFTPYNSDSVLFYKGAEVYKKMLSDPQIKACYNILVDIITSRKYNFITQNDPKKIEIEEFLRFNIDNLNPSFRKLLKNILMAKVHGFSINEINYKAVDYKNSIKWVVDNIKLKNTHDIEFSVDQYGNILEIRQKNTPLQAIPIEKIIYYVVNDNIEPFFGQSDFKAAYRSYWEKDNILKFWNMYLERMAGGFKTVTSETDAPSLSPSERTNLQNSLNKTSNSTAIVLPSGYKLDVTNPVSSQAFFEAVDHRDIQIAKAMLLPNMLGLTGQNKTGSYNQSETQLKLFFATINDELVELAEALNKQLFQRLVKYNYGDVEFPHLEFEADTENEKIEKAKTWIEAFSKNAVQNTLEDENKTRQVLGYSTLDKNENKPNIAPKKDEEIDEKKNFKFKKEKEVSLKEIRDKLDNSSFKKISLEIDKIQAYFIKNIKQEAKKEKVTKKIKLDEVSKNEIKEAFVNVFDKVFQKAMSYAKNNLRKYLDKLPDKVDFNLSFKRRERITEKEIENLIYILSNNLSEEIVDYLYNTGNQVLLDSIVNGYSIDEIIQIYKQRTSTLTGKESKDTSGKAIFIKDIRSRLKDIIETNNTIIWNNSLLNVYRNPKYKGIVEALRYTAVLDKRTTAFCRNYNGFTRPINDPVWNALTPPNHRGCRSSLELVTVFDTWENTEDLIRDKEDNLLQPKEGFGVLK